MTIRSVVFDVGETLTDDTSHYHSWADWLGVPHYALAGLIGAATAHGLDNTAAFKLIKPDFDLEAEWAARNAAGLVEQIEDTDLYPDVRPALASLRRAGIWVGIVGNQTARAAALLRSLNLPVNAITTSGEWGVRKPDSAFFARLIQWAPGTAHEICYVGDQLDCDILPAKKAGLRAAHIRRGPMGYFWADDPRMLANADWRINSLAELPSLLADFSTSTRDHD